MAFREAVDAAVSQAGPDAMATEIVEAVLAKLSEVEREEAARAAVHSAVVSRWGADFRRTRRSMAELAPVVGRGRPAIRPSRPTLAVTSVVVQARRSRIHVPRKGLLLYKDCTPDDLRAAASYRERGAAALIEGAGFLQRSADLVETRGLTTAGDLQDDEIATLAREGGVEALTGGGDPAA